MAATMPKKYSSDRSQRMKELQAEGKMTPDHGKLGGRPRKSPTDTQQPRRAATVIAEAARDNADKMAQVFVDTILSDELTDSQKVAAMKRWVDIENGESDRERDELRDPSSALNQQQQEKRDDAVENLHRMLTHPIYGDRMRAILSAAVASTAKTRKTPKRP